MFGRKFNKRETLYLSAILEDQMNKIEILIGSLPEDSEEKSKESIARIAEMYVFLQKLRNKI